MRQCNLYVCICMHVERLRLHLGGMPACMPEYAEMLCENDEFCMPYCMRAWTSHFVASRLHKEAKLILHCQTAEFRACGTLPVAASFRCLATDGPAVV